MDLLLGIGFQLSLHVWLNRHLAQEDVKRQQSQEAQPPPPTSPICHQDPEKQSGHGNLVEGGGWGFPAKINFAADLHLAPSFGRCLFTALPLALKRRSKEAVDAGMPMTWRTKSANAGTWEHRRRQ